MSDVCDRFAIYEPEPARSYRDDEGFEPDEPAETDPAHPEVVCLHAQPACECWPEGFDLYSGDDARDRGEE